MRKLNSDPTAGKRKPQRQEGAPRRDGALGALAQAMAYLLLALGLLVAPVSGLAEGTAYYTYDPLGELATALYGNGVCTVFLYDANGNWTSQTSTTASAPESPTWGTGTWGCFDWTLQ